MERDDEKRKKTYMVCGVVLLIAALGFFKYTGFVEKTINEVTEGRVQVTRMCHLYASPLTQRRKRKWNRISD